VPQRTGGAVD
jgi:host factor-I protein